MSITSRVGIVAGGGRLPVLLADACREAGRDPFLLALKGDADPELARRAAEEGGAAIRLGEAGTGVKLMRKAGVGDVVFAGKVSRPSFSSLRPDFATIGFLAKVGRRAMGDDGLLRAIADALGGEGFRVVGPLELAPSLGAPGGTLGRHRPDDTARNDVARGIAVAAAVGAVDVGQSVVVQQGIVLAVEAVEGTDAMMQRAATLRRKGDAGVLVKTAKPGQDMRLDVPTVGPETVTRAHAAGLRGIAVEAGRVLVLDRDAVIAEADRLGLFLLGVAPTAAASPPDQ